MIRRNVPPAGKALTGREGKGQGEKEGAMEAWEEEERGYVWEEEC